jgi:hypothetical protein
MCDPRLFMADIRHRLFGVVCKEAQPEWRSLFTVVPEAILPSLFPSSVWVRCPSTSQNTQRFECHCQTCLGHWIGWDSAKSFGCVKQFARDSFGMMVPPMIATWVNKWDPVTGFGSQKLFLEYRWVRVNQAAILYPGGVVPVVGGPWTHMERLTMTANALRFLLEGLRTVPGFQRFAVGGDHQLTLSQLEKQLRRALLRVNQAQAAAALENSDMDISDDD